MPPRRRKEPPPSPGKGDEEDPITRGEDKLLLSWKSHRKIGQFPKVCSLGW